MGNSAIVIFDIDGVVRDVGGSYRRALADTVEKYTGGAYRPSMADIDALKGEGIWNNDWQGSQELVYRYFESQGKERSQVELNYEELVDFFQSRYRGTDPDSWDGYVTSEPLLMQPTYLQQLTDANISWGFFSGATRGSAEYVLHQRLGLNKPILIAMEDAPGKPDPTGLFTTVAQVESNNPSLATQPVIYVGDTVADMYTVVKAQALKPERMWLGAGILPPHIHDGGELLEAYSTKLTQGGAVRVFPSVEHLTPQEIYQLIDPTK